MRRAHASRIIGFTLAAILAGAPSAHAALVLNVFGGRVPCLVQLGVQFCSGTVLTRVESWDGVPIDVNVTIPPFNVNGPFPLIVDLHGWGIGKANQPFVQEALDGYVVLSYSARGFHESCGFPPSRLPDPTLSNPNVCNERGWIHLADARYEGRDTQYLAGLLADEGLVLPDKIGVTGSSYGGGQSMILAALKNRVMLPNGTLVPWKSPGGLDMQIAAAAPIIPWSDLAYALTPNGRTLDYLSLNPYGLRGGVSKQSYVDFLYLLGQVTGFYAPPGVDPAADIQSWNARLDAGEPYDTDPVLVGILDEVTSHHSAYYIDDSIQPAPLFIYNAWTDDLFPATEALRFWRKTKAKYPAAEVALQFADGFGHPRASLAGSTATYTPRVAELFARHLKGSGPALPPLETYTQACGSSTQAGPFAAADWDAIHPGEVRFSDASPKTFTSAAGNASNATNVDPVGPGALTACRSVSSTDDPAAATYRLPAVTCAYTLMGSPTVIADVTANGFAQVAARLWDVAPDNTQALVSQGFYRPRTDNLGPQVFQIPANGWQFVAGHVPKLELLGQSSPFGRASNGTFSVTVQNLELRLPTLESAGCDVLSPAPPVQPPPDAEPPICNPTPHTGCRAPVLPQKSKMLLVNNPTNALDRLSWKWRKGAATTKAEFGTPLATTSYSLCAYDGASNLILTATAPATGVCAGKPCWAEKTRGFKYKDTDRTPTGVQRLQFQEGLSGKAQITLKGRGADLPDPNMPVQLPLTVQLVNTNGACWTTTFSTAKRNDGGQLKATSD